MFRQECLGDHGQEIQPRLPYLRLPGNILQFRHSLRFVYRSQPNLPYLRLPGNILQFRHSLRFVYRTQPNLPYLRLPGNILQLRHSLRLVYRTQLRLPGNILQLWHSLRLVYRTQPNLPYHHLPVPPVYASSTVCPALRLHSLKIYFYAFKEDFLPQSRTPTPLPLLAPAPTRTSSLGRRTRTTPAPCPPSAAVRFGQRQRSDGQPLRLPIGPPRSRRPRAGPRTATTWTAWPATTAAAPWSGPRRPGS